MDTTVAVDTIKKPQIKNVGKVQSVKDGLIILSGLSQAKMGEKIIHPEKNIVGMVLNLNENTVGAVVLGDYLNVQEGDVFETTGDIMSVAASDEMIGRVIDPLGNPLDGRSSQFSNTTLMPVDRIAPGVMERQPVNVPLQTGVLAVDAMIPIGRGQRQLIIGDRSTGKTALTIDTIINQKNAENPVVCIYVAIGQKKSRVAQLVEKLDQYDAMDYSIIVSATASDSVALQYLAPYSATSIAEYLMEQGKNVLIIYDDLSKHAWAYRQISLILERPPGREAYPGDIFYLHSRLLERACRLSEELGGGSITALPIVETQLGDVSAYIPTNIISITDGQIYFENDLFNAGFRPAIDAGNSVSRVGGSAQIKDMKKIAGQLRLDLAQFKEIEAFAQFGSSDLDERTKSRIERGRRIRELLKQKQYNPLDVYVQISLIYAVNQGYFDSVALTDMEEEKEKLITYLKNQNLTDFRNVVDEFFASYNADVTVKNTDE
ncbi:F0F1 ATP synthase subunit alpha [candidate division WWE3 bacterium]|uniref:ATP synthase subunit alpha n=1 Tax=candidate division WWE3 bacterium TaxID=2053526 RepID=A0A955RX73_UNCKA|nr:F0F1 ATP synthase subunit alpha [candidate division WWE3 bacterium]